ncbi:MAG: preprotein translocase subunit SecA [Marinoscillum sp.]|nr:preprotein translocase subunit SecA [Marinoscillum sp.]|tara:strand:+ start:5477 stop:8806 length:3330 start_codon:yes stop_codon:yes gene_type:complete
MFGFLKKILGSKSDKDLKEIYPLVDKINSEYDKLNTISDEDLRSKTEEFKLKIKNSLIETEEEINNLKINYENSEGSLDEKEEILNSIDKIIEDQNEIIENILNEILPEAFAVVKETARRFSENGSLEVKATDFDKEIAQKKENIKIKGSKAIWLNKWEAAGVSIEWNMVHYDVQLIGGVVLHQGKISEMATGEGKTLVATLPAYLNALSGRGVHIVTVNDYLAKRDAEWNAPIFQFHGLEVDCIDKHDSNSSERIRAYNADITYGTNNEFGFDYLRDNMVREKSELVQRKHNFAMVDEVDSVLIDEARTPLIISGPIPKGDVHEFFDLKPRIQKLFDLQKKMVTNYLSEAKKLISEGKEEEGGLSLFRAYRGLPKYKPLIKYLSEIGTKAIMQKTENIYLQDNSKLMPEADEPLYFTIEEKSNSIQLTEKGTDTITSSGDDKNFFIVPDIGVEIDKIEKLDKPIEEIAKEKEKLIQDFSVKTKRIHSINQLLKAYSLFEKDQEYVVMDSKVKIVDEQTGRIMEGRRYSDGLHQAIEAKENVKIEDASQTYATITLQNYFRMYNKLSGMTGTAETEAGEFWEIYNLDCVVIPTNRDIARSDMEDKIYKTLKAKFSAVIDEIIELKNNGRPILVGTTSVEISELLGRMLNMKKIPHQVLNAKQHAKEADIVAEAGKPGTVTIATNMAGRGTDIKLTDKSKESGGLAIIGTERHESRRVDRQLRGRSGRQGDVGSSQFFVSLEDNLMRLFGSDRMIKVMDRMNMDEDEVIQHSMITKSIERAQKKVEENNFAIRKRLLEYDNVMNSQREVIYKKRRNAIIGERLEVDILNTIYDTCDDIVLTSKQNDNYKDFRLNVLTILGLDYSKLSEDDFRQKQPEEITKSLFEAVNDNYNRKNNSISEAAYPILKKIKKERGGVVKDILIPFTDGNRQIGVSVNLEDSLESKGKNIIKEMQKTVCLGMIDLNWKEHLREMDDLKQSVQSAVYEQKDPLVIYKFEGFELFKKFIAKVNQDTVSFLTKCLIPIQSSSQVEESKQTKDRNRYDTNKEESRSLLTGNKTQQIEKTKPIKSEKVFGRNTKVSVRYEDGTVKKDIKFKKVENDINSEKCVVIED